MALAAGARLGPYEILSPLGAGGMGEVYRARDTGLDRDVAIKVLPEALSADADRVARFQREAKVLASLNHPHIALIYGLEDSDGVKALVMELVEGEDVAHRVARGAIPLDEALPIAKQIAEALEAAQAKGVIHRDLKPANIIITQDGAIKVLDFGLAKMLELNDPAEDRATQLSETKDGTILGTPAYMSPEQIRGNSLDRRTDVWSFGCVFYELLSGKSAFSKGTTSDTMASVLEHEPDWQALPPAIPTKVRDLLRRCLQKNIDRRLRDIGDARIEIDEALVSPERLRESARAGLLSGRGVRILFAVLAALTLALIGLFGVTRAETVEALAVLPLQNLSGDPGEEYLSDGMTDALITGLAQIEKLTVISRTSAMHYKGTRKTIQEIARELRVDAVIEGTVMRSSGRIRISVELIRGATARVLWAKSYERDFGDVLALQNDVARAIADEIGVNLSPLVLARLTSKRPVNPQAHEDYLKGRYYRYRRGLENTRTSVSYFQRAVDLDPDYAPALAGLADAYSGLATYAIGFLNPNEAFPRAHDLALKALDVDGNLAEGHVALAVVKQEYDWDWAGAEKEVQRAIQLNPGYFEAYHQYSHLLTAVGRTAESLAASEHALDLDPLALPMNAHLGFHYHYARQPEKAIAQLQKTIAMDNNYPLARFYIGLAYEQKGLLVDAIDSFQKAIVLSRETAPYLSGLGHALALAGKVTDARRIVDELAQLSKSRYVSAFDNAVIYAGLGDKDQAFLWLEKAVDEHSSWLMYLRVEPRLDPLRSDPRFDALLRRLQLPEL